VRELAAALPCLSSLQVSCRAPGLDDLNHLSRIAQLQHLTLLDAPFGGGGNDASGGEDDPLLRRAVGRCGALRTLCVHSDTVRRRDGPCKGRRCAARPRNHLALCCLIIRPA
jgi:hypothetical protein